LHFFQVQMSKRAADNDALIPLMGKDIVPSTTANPKLCGSTWWGYVFVGFISGGLGAGAVYWTYHPNAGTPTQGTVLPQLSQSSWCDKKSFTQTTLRTVVDAPVFGLLPDAGDEFRFETSSVVIAEHGYYAVCDSSWSIPAIHDLGASGSFSTIFSPNYNGNWTKENEHRNYLIHPEDPLAFPNNVDSQWEAVTYHTLLYHHIAVQEAIKLDGEDVYRAVIMLIDMVGRPWLEGKDWQIPKWQLLQACPSEFNFTGSSKGFEGALGMSGIDGRFFLVALCEGNLCAQRPQALQPGHGRLVVMELDPGSGPSNAFVAGKMRRTSTCMWRTVKVVKLPIPYFRDYSDLAERKGILAVTSQENSAVFLGKMVLTKDGLLDPATFDVMKGNIFDFPPTSDCKVSYCNVEAIDFINDRLLVAGSDTMKAKGRQEYQCILKEASMHAFALPGKFHFKSLPDEDL